MANLNDILTKTVSNLTNEQLERAAEVFIHERTSFAVAIDRLWLSEYSMFFFKLRTEYIMYGENGKPE